MTCGSQPEATKMASMPLDRGVVKTCAIWKPMRYAKATTTAVKPPSLLYAGFVKMRYR